MMASNSRRRVAAVWLVLVAATLGLLALYWWSPSAPKT
jgi:hypothetical protein